MAAFSAFLQKMESVSELQRKLGYSFKQPELLDTALTHSSYTPPRGMQNNERLEFLGDAVLNLAISDVLMKKFPDGDEGELSRRRASLVNTRRLADKARDLALGRWIRLGKGEIKSGGMDKDSILAAGYEAVIGAVYLDRGYGAARRFIAQHFSGEVKDRCAGARKDYKTRLQELTQKVFKTIPKYTLVHEDGPDHAKRFCSEISVAGRKLGTGTGNSKKNAEQQAAMMALESLQMETKNRD